jgi:glucose-6-phosphate isomerase
MTPSFDDFVASLTTIHALGLTLDTSRIAPQGRAAFAAHVDALSAPMARAFEAMAALERGAIANPDEKRQVGHYWLRAPSLAPTVEQRRAIEETLAQIDAFTHDVRDGAIHASNGARFTDLLVVGIGGSALGPQLVSRALGAPVKEGGALEVSFVDNTDPDGIDTAIARLGERLRTTLVVVISKSGGTKETRNGMLEVRWRMESLGVPFGKHFVAVTGEGSALDETAKREGWLARFPMWDWVGGRTSELSAVGLLPAALEGIDVRAMLEGARICDEATRVHDVAKNPAAQLALAWHFVGGGKGARDMVVLPYKDRIELFSRYLQQLVMESLGKEKDLDGKVVHQGIAVYGNKGSTDQHAYVQQLRDGVSNFFVTFVEVLRDRADASHEREVEAGVTSGDYLLGFLLGTRRALFESGRPSLTITVADTSPRTLGALIALFERAVGFYASLVNVNAYHQPGVEAGKKAAADVLALQHAIVAHLRSHAGTHDARAIAKGLGRDDAETIYQVCRHLAANGRTVRVAACEGRIGEETFVAT